MSLHWVVLILISCILSAPTLWAMPEEGCKLEFDKLQTKVKWEGGSGAYAGKYNPFDPISYVQSLSFDVVNKNNVACPYFIDAEHSRNTGSYDRELKEGDRRLRYNLYIDAALSKVWKGAETSPSSVIQGFAEAGNDSRTTQVYYFNIEPLQLVKDGKMSKDKVKLGLWRGLFDSSDRRREKFIEVEYKAEVPKVVDVSLVDSDTGFIPGQINRFVDFGFLTAQDSESFDLIVRYNKKYDLSFESRNKGKMVNSTSPQDTVIYEFLVNGDLYDLKKKGKKIMDQGNPDFEGDRHQLMVRIADSIEDKARGIYSDVITGIIKAK